ncbi:C39 family peptidase [Planomonospora sp. ID82291]|uniref:C39 family peptidase n=1 Tax=Planomonospora sp. ID82291 TaxID=2738136 RepID=UPI0018C40A64|nr:C39 family peptidase [Planomonospora sp. ID82291]MBG0818416.1 C39 family peptidase [Planomonospora sp. ID82291]
MSPEKIAAIAYQGADAADDPRWEASGAHSREEYGRWCRHCCGMACLQMVLHHRDGHAPPLLELARTCTAYGGYIDDGSGGIRGLFYAPFTAFVRAEYGLDAEVHPHLTMAEIGELLASGHLVMASVHKEIRRPERPAPGRGGHLVLLTGHGCGVLQLNNPSGHTPTARRAVVPIKVFETFFGGRGIALAPR